MSKPVLSGWQLPIPFCSLTLSGGLARGFPFSWANETTPAAPLCPSSQVTQDRAEGLEIWMRAQPLLAVKGPLPRAGGGVFQLSCSEGHTHPAARLR